MDNKQQLESILSNCIQKEVIDKIKRSNYYEISKSKKHKITIIPNKTEIKYEKDQDGVCIKEFETHSIFIPQDEYYRALAFSLENLWFEKNKGSLDKSIQNFKLSPTMYIYHDLIQKTKSNCDFEIKVEFNLQKIQYEKNNEIIDFSYDIDEDVYDEYEEDEESVDKEYRENIEKFKDFCEYVIEKIEDCGQFTILTLTNWNSKTFSKDDIEGMDESGHRNMILIENTDDEIYFHHYEPHGSETDYLYDEREDFFEKLQTFILKSIMKKNMKFINLNLEKEMLIMKIKKNKKKLKNISEEDTNSSKKMKELNLELKKLNSELEELNYKLEELKKHKKMKKIEIKAFNSSYCLGLQTYLKDYDEYGYCSLFSFFWLYSILKCFFCIKNKYDKTPPLYTWVGNFEKILIEKFKNKHNELYDLIITFAYRLFTGYFTSGIITEEDKLNIVHLQNKSQEYLFKKYNDYIEDGKIKVIVEKISEKVDDKYCKKNIIESGFVIKNENEDEEIKSVDYDEYIAPSPPKTPDYQNFRDDEFKIEYANEEDNDKQYEQLTDEEKRKLLQDYYGHDFDINIENIDVEPREYGDEDMNLEFVDETNQNEY
jgi:hypothetical protein